MARCFERFRMELANMIVRSDAARSAFTQQRSARASRVDYPVEKFNGRYRAIVPHDLFDLTCDKSGHDAGDEDVYR